MRSQKGLNVLHVGDSRMILHRSTARSLSQPQGLFGFLAPGKLVSQACYVHLTKPLRTKKLSFTWSNHASKIVHTTSPFNWCAALSEISRLHR